MLGDASLTRLGTVAQDALGIADGLLVLGTLIIQRLDLRVALSNLLGLLETKTLKLGLSLRDDLLRGALRALV